MASFCLTKEFTDKFLQGLRSGEIDPEKMVEMTSEDRRNYLTKFVGEENAKQVNSLFESKLLLKHREQGFINWAKRVGSITQEARRDIIARVQRMDKILDPQEEDKFLHDLAATRLGLDVTPEEAKNIVDLSKKIQDTKTTWETTLKEELAKNSKYDWKNAKERWDYGYSQVNFENYFNSLKLNAKAISLKENPAQFIKNAVGNIPGIMKSVVASLDNSFFGRQGIKTLYTHPTVWLSKFLASWKDLGRQAFAKGAWYKSGDDAVLDSIKADIYSRPNAVNGKYKAGNYGLDVLSEEQYPSSIPEKIPLLGRLFKASEVAYNGAALRMRADLADMLIGKAEKMGVNTLDPKEAQGMGRLIGSLTGRGHIQLTEGQSKLVNALFFSVKFLKSNFDTLTAHQFDSKANAFVKKEAALNLLKIVSTTATILTIAKLMNPNSVDEDPRSSNFGKIKIFGHWTDITGGMGSIVTLASRTLVPTLHNGEWGFWEKTSTGAYTNLGSKYGLPNPLDAIFSFFEGKLSPTAGIVRDYLTRKTYSGKPFSLQNELPNQLPLSLTTFNSLMSDPNSSFVLGSLILDGLGFAVNTNQPNKDWSSNPTKAQQAFLNKVGQDKFNAANDKFNTQYNSWFNRISATSEYKNLSDTTKQALTTKAKEEIQTKVFKEYGFVYKAPKNSTQQKNEAKNVKRLLSL